MSSELNLNLDNSDEKPSSKSLFRKILSGLGAALLLIPRKARIVITIVGVTFAIMALLTALQPQAEKRAIPETVVKVDVIEVAPSDYPIIVATNGTIQADTRGNLVSQIRGEIVRVSDKFRTGGSFKKGEVLAEVDQRDYLAARSQALAAVSQAKANYRQEVANAKQATRDWERLGNTGSAPDLVARKPQLAAAKAQLESAEANLETAKLNLERTYITAPYTGRIIQRQAVLGQYVSIGSVLAEVFATEGVELRLPLSQDEFSQLGLDSLSNDQFNNQFAVTLSTQVGSQRYFWDANVTRTDSTFDLNTRQIDVIATVKDPFSSAGNKPPLKIGQFVNANIQGRTVESAMVVPNKALREGNYVFVSQDQRLERRPVTVIWQDDQNALIESGLNAGDLVVTTSLNSTLAGAKVKFSDSLSTEPAEALAENPNAEDSPEPNIAPELNASSDTGEIPAQAQNDLKQTEQALEQQLEDVINETSGTSPNGASEGGQVAEPPLTEPLPEEAAVEPVNETVLQNESGGTTDSGNAAIQN